MKYYRKIWYIRNIPNTLTIIRVILSLVLIILAVNKADFITLAAIFIIAALTDAADGFLARRYDLITNFGRKADPIADRFLTISAVTSFIIYFIIRTELTSGMLSLILLTMTREIICAPIFIIALFIKKSRKLPHARWVGKITTFVQGITFALIILGWKIAPVAAGITALLGVICLGYFLYDSIINPNNRMQRKLDNYYKQFN